MAARFSRERPETAALLCRYLLVISPHYSGYVVTRKLFAKAISLAVNRLRATRLGAPMQLRHKYNPFSD
jgi:hypothetical protein